MQPTQPIRGRRHAIAGALLGALCLLLGGAPATGQTTPTTEEGRTTDCSLEQLKSEFTLNVTGATITRPGEPDRRLDARHAFGFLQTWLPYAIFGNPPQDVPGPEIPRWTVVVDTPGSNQSGNITVFVASDDTDVWVGSRNNEPPPPEKAIKVVDPEKTLAAMDGLVEPTCLAPVAQTSVPLASTTTAGNGASATSSDGTDSGDDGPGALTVVLVALGAAILGGLTVTALRRRS